MLRACSKPILAMLLALAPSGLRAQTTPPGTSPVPVDVQDKVEADVSKFLSLPETAEWQFAFIAPYPGGGDVVCGSVDFQSLERKYIGKQRFFSLVRDGKVTFSQMLDPPAIDVTGNEALKFHLLCDRK
jgi:hypothetical protein